MGLKNDRIHNLMLMGWEERKKKGCGNEKQTNNVLTH